MMVNNTDHLMTNTMVVGNIGHLATNAMVVHNSGYFVTKIVFQIALCTLSAKIFNKMYLFYSVFMF